MTTTEPARLLAFIEKTDPLEGPILAWEEGFDAEIATGGRLLEDHVFDHTKALGLSLFEGYVEVGTGPDPDVHFRGQWRQLTHWEMLQVRSGGAPWTKP